MQKKKILILGANPETVSLIEKAKSMGLYTIVTDYNPNAYAKTFADKSYNIDASDVEALYRIALEEKVNGILVGVAEALLPAYCALCERLGMPCYSTPEKFDIMVRKDLFKEKCREYGVPTIQEYDAAHPEKIEYPVIVKPVDSCSSKGISVCKNKEELDSAIQYALAFSKSGKYLIERQMTGDEVIEYYTMQDGNPIFTAMCDRYTYRAEEGLVQLPIAYIYPSRHIDSYLSNEDAAVKKMIRKLGLDNGTIFFQSFICDDQTVRIYEPGYRLNGAQEHLMVSRVSGIDARELYINYALTGKVAKTDLEPLSNPKPKQICCKLSPLVKTGKIFEINGLEQIRQLENVVAVAPSYRTGEEVTGTGTLKQIVCRFFIVAENKETLADTIDRIYELLRVTDKNGNDMLMGKFDTNIVRTLY